MNEVVEAVIAGAAKHGSEGNPWGIIVLLVVLGVVFSAFVVKTILKERKPPSDCGGSSCTGIAEVVNEIKHINKTLESDAVDRKEHRERVENSITRIHERIDRQNEHFMTRAEAESLTGTFHRATEELSAALATVIAFVESNVSQPAPQRMAPRRRKMATQ